MLWVLVRLNRWIQRFHWNHPKSWARHQSDGNVMWFFCMLHKLSTHYDIREEKLIFGAGPLLLLEQQSLNVLVQVRLGVLVKPKTIKKFFSNVKNLWIQLTYFLLYDRCSHVRSPINGEVGESALEYHQKNCKKRLITARPRRLSITVVQTSTFS